MKSFFSLLSVVLALVAVMSLPGGDAQAQRVKARDICIVSPTGGGTFNTFVLRDVGPLNATGAIPIHGLFFTGARRVAPVHGTAAMANDGTVRVGMFIHSSADSTNDFTAAGVTDANFVGTLSFDNDGDFVPNGTLAMQLVDCATISIP